MRRSETAERIYRDGRYVCSRCGYDGIRRSNVICPSCGRRLGDEHTKSQDRR